MTELSGEYFRAGVGAMIIDPSSGNVLMLRRVDVDNAWQMVQGGINKDESPRDAMIREVQEEAGLATDDYKIVHELGEWLAYELPDSYRSKKTGRGQVQKWFLLTIRSKSHVTPDGKEFDKAEWFSSDKIVSSTVPFRAPIYSTLLKIAKEKNLT